MHTNRLISLTCRPLAVLLYLLLTLFLPNNLSAQNATKPVAAWLEGYRTFADFRQVALFQRAQERSDVQLVAGKSSILNLDQAAVAELLQTAPQALRFAIPTAEGTIELELAQVEILAPDFFVSTNTQNSVPYQPAIHYRGIVLGDANSVASLSVSSSGVIGMVADETGTYQLGQMEDGSENYVYYKTQNLIALSPNHCFSDEESLMGDAGGQPSSGDRGVGCKTVQIYFECDYKLYTDKGSSTTDVSNYVTSLFNQIATLYANENVGVVISQIYVWTSSDPYVGYNSTSAVLNAFRQTRGTSFNGNLAHLLSTRSLGGGIAYVDVICVKQYAFGVSAITTSFQNVPTYSWTVEVVTHELGHNLGSWHTQSCNWPTGALDNCVNPEGSCPPGPAPVNGGTIMSYCHLTGYGINFNKGFGPSPGAKIRDKVLNSNCVPQSGVIPAGLTTSNITSTSATLSWVPVAGATSYTVQYKLNTSAAWTTAGTSTAPTYNLNNLTANSLYNWQVKTDCSNFSATANFTTSNSGGGNPCNAPTGLAAVSISASSATLIWSAVANATSYTVQYKTSSSSIWISAGSTASVSLVLNNLTAATNYNWQVKASCSVWSATSSFSTPNSGGGGSCDPPATLNNNTIGSTYAVISWSAVTGATNYTLQIKLASSSDWFTLGAVSVTSVVISGLQPSTSYHWRVKASCSDYSSAKLLTTTANFGGGNGEGNLSQPTLVENNEMGALELFPNPVNERLNLRFVGEISNQHQIMMTDAMGRVVLEQSFQSSLYVAALAPGVYFVTLLEEGQRIATQRFVKM